jgi:predicted AlkP superfamily phosphohydrolase/phosphomutase
MSAMLALLQFDSPALPVIERMLADGRLPALAELRRRGTWQALDPAAVYLQSATYPTLCTGVDVTEHGLYSSFPWSPRDQRVRFLQAFPRPATIWERLHAAGRRSLVVDPYLAWAPRTIDGVYLSGWQFEDRMVEQGRSRPLRLRRALARKHGRPPRLDDVYGRPRASALLALHAHLVAAPGRTAAAVTGLLARERFDFAWINFSAAHKAGHHLWDAASLVEEPLAPDAARTLDGALEDVYAAVDTGLGRILEALPDGTDVIAFSPTGMGPSTSRADVLPAMLRAVLSGATGGPRPGSSRTPVWSVRSRIPTRWRSNVARALPDRLVADMTTRLYLRADWATTRAIAVPGENKGYVRLNIAGRERKGIVAPGEADELLATISEGLQTFTDPDGAPSIEQIDRMSELAGGAPYSERLPDLVISWPDRPTAGLAGVTSPRYGSIERRGVGSGRSGNHADDAWAILAPASTRVRDPGRAGRITDLGATACSLLEAGTDGLSGVPLLERR